MWSCNRRTLLCLAAAALALASCGFQPAYGPAGPATRLQASISLDPPADKDGFDLVERLEQRLGHAEGPAYHLSYAIETQTNAVGITQTYAITRYNINGSVRYALRDLASGAELTSGIVDSFTAHSASSTTFSTLIAERDAKTRLMRLLADQIALRLMATSGVWGK